ncbi:uncharacterized protein BJ212DRAFT_1296446 [Suillus subaureus]|uniref:Uncharacterized protein n=1 Tax=Suillus subaureus TaxID=48587 RepID=A0A9P7EJU5_9AGAM|nr:uncharacterized protein BJ212DRAFT_1296446 [Suillus subaureus]KAG1823928.1 hypothetical protein BJ212DRAFT_1296446 [Suillus subaureus]
MSQSDFHVNTVFQEAVPTAHAATQETQSMKSRLWWMSRDNDLLIQECSTNATRTWPNYTLSPIPQHDLVSVIVDPLQDLVVTISSPYSIDVHNFAQAQHAFWLEIYMLSSQAPHPDSACTSLDYRHHFNARGIHHVVFMKEPAICGDRIVVPYCTHTDNTWAKLMYIQVVDWKKGQVECHQQHPIDHQVQRHHQYNFHFIDQQTFVVIDLEASISLYTLQEFGRPPRRRIIYCFPVYHSARCPSRNSSPRPYAQLRALPESQIMVLEMLLPILPVILVIDMAIFSEKALHSEALNAMPWSDWGPQHTCCFPHDPSHRISVFGSRMAYALPRYRTPTPGHRLEALSADGRFHVHMWDFNQKVIARSKSISDSDLPGHLICKPACLGHTCYNSDFSSNRSYTATVCHESFPTRDFERLFLEQDRFTLTWVRPDAVDIKVVSPILETKTAAHGGCPLAQPYTGKIYPGPTAMHDALHVTAHHLRQDNLSSTRFISYKTMMMAVGSMSLPLSTELIHRILTLLSPHARGHSPLMSVASTYTCHLFYTYGGWLWTRRDFGFGADNCEDTTNHTPSLVSISLKPSQTTRILSNVGSDLTSRRNLGFGGDDCQEHGQLCPWPPVSCQKSEIIADSSVFWPMRIAHVVRK